jgi:hypothetical protein
MSAYVLVSGALSRAPEFKTSKSGKPYVMASLRVGVGSAAEFWSVIASSESTHAELSRLGDGDKISAQGTLEVGLHTGQNGQTWITRTVLADHVARLDHGYRSRQDVDRFLSARPATNRQI